MEGLPGSGDGRLAEMAQFLTVHARQALPATPSEALWHTTVAPAQILGLHDQLGTFAPGRPLSYIEAASDPAALVGKTADAVITDALARLAADGSPYGPELMAVTQDAHRTAARLDRKIRRVVQAGKLVWERLRAQA